MENTVQAHSNTYTGTETNPFFMCDLPLDLSVTNETYQSIPEDKPQFPQSIDINQISSVIQYFHNMSNQYQFSMSNVFNGIYKIISNCDKLTPEISDSIKCEPSQFGIDCSASISTSSTPQIQGQEGYSGDSVSEPDSKPSISKKSSSFSNSGKGGGCHLWQFLLKLLDDSRYNPSIIKWVDKNSRTFKLVQSASVAKLWGEQKKKPRMNYETMGRALRYYYARNIMKKINGQRLVYQFVTNPSSICD